MKPRRTQGHVKHSQKEEAVGIGPKPTPNQPKSASCTSHHARTQPFSGRVFYLDLPSNRKAETLESDIKYLGGTVEKFFSKEITYLVSNKKEAKYVQSLRHESPIPSPDSGHGSPQPCSPRSHRNNLKGTSKHHTDTVVKSRGKSLVEKVVKEQERIQMNKILSNALEWGVKVLYIDDVMAYIEKKKKSIIPQCNVTTASVKKHTKAESTGRPAFQKYKGGRINKPFVKVEDSSRQYRPIYLAMPNMPEFNLTTAPPCGPFYVEDKDVSGRKHRERRDRGVRASASEEKGQARHRKHKDKKRGGYCECCALKYDNLNMHVQSESHKAFSKSDEYLVVDSLVSAMHYNFIHIKDKSRKCSISSVILASGPCGRTDQWTNGDSGTKETEKGQETHCPAPACGEVNTQPIEPCHTHSLVPAAAPPVSHTEGNKGNSDCFQHRPQMKRRPVALRPRSCRQASLNSGLHRTEPVHTLGPEPEMMSDNGRSRYFDPAISRIPQDPRESWQTSPDKCRSTSNNLGNNLPSERFGVTSRLHETPLTVKLQDPPATEFAWVGPTPLGNIPECDKGDGTTQSHSVVGPIRRKVRVYERKRQKVDAHLRSKKPATQSTASFSSMLNLWQLFQSSEDMDVEFLGFED